MPPSAGEAGIGFDECAVDEFAVSAVLAIEVLFDGFLADDLIAQEAIEQRCAAIGKEHVWLEEPPEHKAAKRGGGSVCK